MRSIVYIAPSRVGSKKILKYVFNLFSVAFERSWQAHFAEIVQRISNQNVADHLLVPYMTKSPIETKCRWIYFKCAQAG